jgi:hypothetical protein
VLPLCNWNTVLADRSFLTYNTEDQNADLGPELVAFHKEVLLKYLALSTEVRRFLSVAMLYAA